jgi:hypothetical protein
MPEILVTGKRQCLEGRIVYEGLRFDVPGECCWGVPLSAACSVPRRFCISFADEVPGCIQLYKPNHPWFSQGCFVQGHNNIVGNVEIMHIAIKPEIYFTIFPILV